jgi:hypothetical protein
MFCSGGGSHDRRGTMNRSTQRLIASHERMQKRLENARSLAELRTLVEEMVEHAGFELLVLRPQVEGQGELEQRLLDGLGSQALLLDLMDSCSTGGDFGACLTKAQSYFQLHRAALDRLLLPQLDERLSDEADRALEQRIENWAPARPGAMS